MYMCWRVGHGETSPGSDLVNASKPLLLNSQRHVVGTAYPVAPP